MIDKQTVTSDNRKVQNVTDSALFLCPDCRGIVQLYDSVHRIIRTKGRKTGYVKIRRYRCINCKAIHRRLPRNILPFKQYEKELVYGVAEGLITADTLGYEDYPCEATMKRWIDEYR